MLCRFPIQPKRLDGQNIEKCLAPHIWGAICTTYHAMFSRWCHMSLSDKHLNQPFPFKPPSRGRSTNQRTSSTSPFHPYEGLFTYYVSRETEKGGVSQNVTIADEGG